MATIEQILDRITVTDAGCWIFPRTYPNGYGQTHYAGRTALVHRVAWQALVGEIPAGLVLDHLCSVRACCNPDHLEPVTQGENLRRAKAKDPTCKRGHEWTPENTLRRRGKRRCAQCYRLMEVDLRKLRRRGGPDDRLADRIPCPDCGLELRRSSVRRHRIRRHPELLEAAA